MSSHNSNAISPSAVPLKLSMGRRADRPDVETEYTELQRQYRAVEAEKKAYTEKTQTQLKKVESMAERLQEENGSLQQEIKNLEQRQLAFQQNTISPQVAMLSEKISIYTAKVESATNKLQQMETESQFLQQKIKHQQDLLGGIGLTQIEHQTSSYIKTLENRLQNALSKYSETTAATKKLRNDIESKKREKQVFDNLTRKREKDIIDRKKRMSKIVEESNYAYEARDDLQNKMFSIRERMVKEAAEHEEQLAELDKIILQEENRKIEIEQQTTTLGTQYDPRSSTTEPDLFRTRATKSRASTDPGSSLEDQLQSQSIEDHIQKYEDFFSRLSPLTGDLREPNDIVNKIISDEFQNFSRYNFINETNKEAEKLEAEIKTLKLEVERYRKAEDTGGDKIRKRLLEGLQQQLEDTEKKTEIFEMKATQCLKVFSIKEYFHEILDLLGEERSRTVSLHELNEANIWPFLAAIAQSLSAPLQAHHKAQGQHDADPHDSHSDPNGTSQAGTGTRTGTSSGAGAGPHPRFDDRLGPPSALVQIDPPTTGYDTADPEDQVYPFSSEEMRMKLTGNWTGLPGINTSTQSPSRSRKGTSSPSRRSRPSTSASNSRELAVNS